MDLALKVPKLWSAQVKQLDKNVRFHCMFYTSAYIIYIVTGSIIPNEMFYYLQVEKRYLRIKEKIR